MKASTLKVKLVMANIGISSIHLFKTFISAKAYDEKPLLTQTGLHLTFPISFIRIGSRLLRPHHGRVPEPIQQ
jgi:uncharacterized protein (TIGR00645 family)